MPRNELKPIRFGLPDMPSIADYLKRRDEYNNLPARINKDGMKILYKGKWMTKEQLEEVVKAPSIPNFTANLSNQDKTKLWMYK